MTAPQRSARQAFSAALASSRARDGLRPNVPPVVGARGCVPEMAALAGSGLVRGEHALAVGDAEEEPEPGDVIAQRVESEGLAADEPGQGCGEGGAVGFQPVA